MKIKMGGLKVLLLGALSLSLVGCNGKMNYEETKVYSLDIDGNSVYMEEEQEEVVSIKEVTEGFINAIMASDYKNPNTRLEQEYYPSEVKEANLANQVPESKEKKLIDRQLVVVMNEMEMNNIRFATVQGEESCFVSYTFISTIEHATPEYLESFSLEQNVKYRRTMQLQLVNENGEWKVVTYSTSTREKVA